ncbi:NAD(P)-binding protein [Lophiostoma macrostomum CBS 122681]|uniref:NAD(P)-binding protein n=1 Tax=Lophiostoma macrostomum CBS 122681 TaxID=1314788 RepID=A0A6A6T609_9PLEO|nr:NAD(P)-binding protein [Lophiostoma macrostomum CBS 122681]
MANNHIIAQPRPLSALLYIAFALPLLFVVYNTFQQSNYFTMSSEIKNVIIIGAGGNLGPSVLNAFLDEPSFNTTVLSREGSSSTFPEGVKVIHADYDSIDSLKSAFKGQDAVISLVGGSALGDQNKLIDAAIAAGAKRFIPSEFGSDTVSATLREIVPVFNAKYATVEYLNSKESSISWTSVITGAFFDWGLKVGFLGFNAQSKTATLVDNGVAQFSATNLRTIGQALVRSLQSSNLDATKNQYVYISSFTTSQADLLSLIEKITGAKWTVENVSSAELKKRGDEKLAKQDFSGIPDLIRAGAFGDKGLSDHRKLLWDEKLGLEKENFEETVKLGLAGKLAGEKL